MKGKSVPIEARQRDHGYDEPFLFAGVYAIWDFDFTFYRQLRCNSSLVDRYRFTLVLFVGSHNQIPNISAAEGDERRGTASCKATPQRSTPMITNITLPEDATRPRRSIKHRTQCGWTSVAHLGQDRGEGPADRREVGKRVYNQAIAQRASMQPTRPHAHHGIRIAHPPPSWSE